MIFCEVDSIAGIRRNSKVDMETSIGSLDGRQTFHELLQDDILTKGRQYSSGIKHCDSETNMFSQLCLTWAWDPNNRERDQAAPFRGHYKRTFRLKGIVLTPRWVFTLS